MSARTLQDKLRLCAKYACGDLPVTRKALLEAADRIDELETMRREVDSYFRAIDDMAPGKKHGSEGERVRAVVRGCTVAGGSP